MIARMLCLCVCVCVCLQVFMYQALSMALLLAMLSRNDDQTIHGMVNTCNISSADMESVFTTIQAMNNGKPTVNIVYPKGILYMDLFLLQTGGR